MSTIFCFSATGNSLYAANRIADTLNGKVISMTANVEECNDDTVGFVFPVFFLGLPVIVEKFITRLKITNPNAYIFVAATCGNFTFHLGGAVNKILKKKGLRLSYYARIHAVENYTPIYPVDNIPMIHKRMDREIQKIEKQVLSRKKKIVLPYGLINKAMHLRYPVNRAVPCDSRFTVADCKSCGMCEKVCPNHNIKIENGKPVFQGDCQLCLACLHICPQKAINWNEATRKHDRYINPHITRMELMKFMNQKQ